MSALASVQPGLFEVNELQDIVDQTDRRVLETLANPDWDFRTIAGISRETRIPEDEVKRALQAYPQLVRKSAVPDKEGRALYTLRTRPIPRSENVALVRVFLTKSI